MGKYNYNFSVFSKEDHISYYLLGLYITDGNIYLGKNKTQYCAEIKLIDQDMILAIRELVCPDKSIEKVSNSNCYRFRIYDKQIVNWFMSKGCIPNKTKIVNFPVVPDQYLPDFLRGLVDGDGSIGIYDKAMLRFDSASLSLIEGVSKAFIKLGIPNKIVKTKWFTGILNGKKVESKTQMYRIAISGANCFNAVNILYNNANLALSRKLDLYNKIIDHYNSLYPNLVIDKKIKLGKLANVTDEQLMLAIDQYKGNFTKVGLHFKVDAQSILFRLKKIGKYLEIRQKYPVNPISNIKNMRKLKISDEQLQQIYKQIDQGLSYRQIGNQYNLSVEYIAFLVRRRAKGSY